ncbi:MAG: dTMP kinase [Treponemataceae bacterium]
MVLQTFIAFEGLDGTGTSTQINLLAAKLKKENVFITAEPTQNQIGTFLRKILKGQIEIHPKTAAYLFAADRCEHVYGKEGIIEQHNSGKIIVSDRYLFSSLAYQSLECGEELPYALNRHFPLPSTVFFFDLEPEKSLERVLNRAKKNGEQMEIYEKLEFQRKTYEMYKKIMKYYEENHKNLKIIRIDAEKSIEEIHQKIWTIVNNMPILKCESK